MLSEFNPANISFSQHALTRMAERNISKDEVIAVLTHPREVIESSEERFEARGLIQRGERQMLLRVIYAHGAILTVITVVATSQLAKYGVNP
jgi:uncharacterized membrane protein YdbT with pleckstrin-like domain